MQDLIIIKKDAPVICVECEFATIKGNASNRHLYCEKQHRMVYNSKPDWCPVPLYEK